jgi:Arc/MetJ-type ribon-helix-helix transcriptional regulator
MPIRTIQLPDHLNAFIDEQVRLGRHNSPDDVIGTAVERYAQDVAAELELATLLNTGDFDRTTVRALLMQVSLSRTDFLVPVTLELRDRIEKLIGPISEIGINLDIKIRGDSEL